MSFVRLHYIQESFIALRDFYSKKRRDQFLVSKGPANSMYAWSSFLSETPPAALLPALCSDSKFVHHLWRNTQCASARHEREVALCLVLDHIYNLQC